LKQALDLITVTSKKLHFLKFNFCERLFSVKSENTAFLTLWKKSYAGKHIAAVLPDTSSSGRDVRPLDVTVTSQTTRLVVLLTGVEGVEFTEVHVYQLRCSLPPAEVSNQIKIKSNQICISITHLRWQYLLLSTVATTVLLSASFLSFCLFVWFFALLGLSVTAITHEPLH